MSMKNVINRYKLIVQIAAEEFYNSEVITTEMEDLLVGENKEYANKEDWIECKIKEWSALAKHTIKWQ